MHLKNIVKPILILLLSFSFTLAALGQDLNGFANKSEAKNQVANGVKDGKWIEYYNMFKNVTNDTAISIFYSLTIYKAGEPVGIRRFYYMNGQLEGIIPFKDGKEDGVAKEYYPDGKLEVKTPYKQGKIEGVRSWYYKSGQLKNETVYTNDIPGVSTDYYEGDN